MAEYQEVIKQFKRMCKSIGNCERCPIKDHREIFHCWRWISEEPKLAEEMIMNWASENPPITNRMKFREVFGKDLIITGDTSKWLDEEYKEK